MSIGPDSISTVSSVETPLRVEIITQDTDFDTLKEHWEDLVESADCKIYQSFDWNRVWWKHFGRGKQLHIILVYDDEHLIGIIPLFKDTIQLKNYTYSCLRYIGSTVSEPDGENLLGLHPYSDYLDFIIRSGYEKHVIFAFVHHLRTAQLDFNETVLDETPEDSSLWELLVPELKKKNIDFKVEESSVCPQIKLSGSWDDYQKQLSKKARYNNNRYLRMVDDESKKGFHIKTASTECEVDEAFELLVKLHQQRWNHLGFPGAFAEKRMYDFLREVTTKFFRKNWVIVRTAEPVFEKGKIIAVDLLFKYRKHVSIVHRALDQDSPYSKAGPGNVLLSVAIKEAADEGNHTVDFLRGEEAFKFRTANTTTTNRKITIQNPDTSVKTGMVTELLKSYITLKRRAELEQLQFILFFKGLTASKGVSGYIKFLANRLHHKFRQDEK